MTGPTRRGVLRAIGALAGLAALPGAAAADGDDDEPAPVRVPDRDLQTTAHAYVDVPRGTLKRAEERAARAGEPDRVESYLLDYVFFQWAYVIDGEVVLEPDEFDPEQVVAPDEETVVNLSEVYGEAEVDDGDE